MEKVLQLTIQKAHLLPSKLFPYYINNRSIYRLNTKKTNENDLCSVMGGGGPGSGGRGSIFFGSKNANGKRGSMFFSQMKNNIEKKRGSFFVGSNVANKLIDKKRGSIFAGGFVPSNKLQGNVDSNAVQPKIWERKARRSKSKCNSMNKTIVGSGPQQNEYVMEKAN